MLVYIFFFIFNSIFAPSKTEMNRNEPQGVPVHVTLLESNGFAYLQLTPRLSACKVLLPWFFCLEDT